MKSVLQLLIAATLFASCNPASDKPKDIVIVSNPQPTTALSARTKLEKKNIVYTKRFYQQVINNHKLEMLDSLLSPDYIEHYKDRHFTEDRKGLSHALTDFFSAFPDINIRTNFIVADSNLVTVQFTMTGTNTGSMFGHKPSGKKVKVDGADIMRFENGKCVEHWGYIEETKFLHQLGMPPNAADKGNENHNTSLMQKQHGLFAFVDMPA